ncbi:MAG: hypothetical protein M3Z26_12025 [Bacteroidota bacterium]|nr:hypothetical protein [Bacteroidota bacterium]
MTKITPEELVKFLYKETSEQRAAAINGAMEDNWNLRESYEELLSAKKDLDEAKFSPRNETVDKILEYAAKKQEQIHSH